MAGRLNWQPSVPWVCIADFQADDNFELWWDRARREEKRQRTPDRRLGRRKLQLKCKFCFVFQRSFADKFSVSCAFFRHEQRVSLRLALSGLSEMIISCNEQFCAKKIISLRNIYITDVTDLQNVHPLSRGTTHWLDSGIGSCSRFQK